MANGDKKNNEVIEKALKTNYQNTELPEVLNLPIDSLKSVDASLASSIKTSMGVETIEHFITSNLFSELLHIYELKIKLDIIRSCKSSGKKYIKIYSKKENKDIDVCIDENLSEEELINRIVALSNAVTTG